MAVGGTPTRAVAARMSGCSASGFAGNYNADQPVGTHVPWSTRLARIRSGREGLPSPEVEGACGPGLSDAALGVEAARPWWSRSVHGCARANPSPRSERSISVINARGAAAAPAVGIGRRSYGSPLLPGRVEDGRKKDSAKGVRPNRARRAGSSLLPPLTCSRHRVRLSLDGNPRRNSSARRKGAKAAPWPRRGSHRAHPLVRGGETNLDHPITLNRERTF